MLAVLHVGRIGTRPKGQCPPTRRNRSAPMPNIENLKKQAKLILRWHRDRYYPVAAQIRTVLPRYRELSDSEVLAASFRLSDAQEFIARQHGFESWRALKRGIDTMPEPADRPHSKPVITATPPNCLFPISRHRVIFSRKSSAFPLYSSTGNRRSTRKSEETRVGSTSDASMPRSWTRS
jgi:hypothetical protein